jgi:5-hydroxyisourate hydrolase-like protein (transthyretin family)
MKKSFLIIFLLFVFAGEGNACTCAGTRMPCEAYWNASAVFLGTVSYSTTTTSKQGDFDLARRVFRFYVDKAFRGVEGKEVEVLTGYGGGDCGYEFQLGGQYLVYAHRNEANILSTGICSRTRPASEAAEDLAYFRELSKAEPGGTIFGEVKLGRRREIHRSGPTPVKGVKILLAGPDKHYESTTDDEGNYKVSGVTPGSYKVKVELPAGTSIHNPEREVKVSNRGCAQAVFWVEPDTRVTGKVLDAQGLPASDVLMELIPASRDSAGYASYVRTGNEGRYEMKLVQPGRYLLGVRIAGSAGSTYVPFPQTYYPGVSDQSRATIIILTEGQQFEANEFILPARFVERQLNGIVQDSSGQPIPGATVWLKENQYKDFDMPYRRETDSEGRFSFPVYESIKYSISAYRDATGATRKQAESIQVVVSANLETLTLVLR